MKSPLLGSINASEMPNDNQETIEMEGNTIITAAATTQDEGNINSSSSAATVRAQVDRDYFSSYEDLEVHRLMLKDVPRTEAYRKAIWACRHWLRGKTVMDIGAGTGVLSLFCAKAGAARVYAVEAATRTADVARAVIERNGFSHVIQVIEGRAELVELPGGEKVDAIVSEWMGFYLLHESMLESVLLAREKHLKPDTGLMMPSRAVLYAAACRQQLPDDDTSNDNWSDMYGLDLSPVLEAISAAQLHRPQVAVVAASDLLTEPVVVADFDLAWLGIEEMQRIVSRSFASVTALDATQYQGVCLWFDCTFQPPEEEEEAAATEDDGSGQVVVLSTSPSAQPTHWKQTIIRLPAPIDVEEGDIIGWELSLEQDAHNPRRYVMQLDLLDAETDEHPVPCRCGAARCAIITAFMDKEDQEMEAKEREENLNAQQD